MGLSLPSLQAAAVDGSGRFTQAWIGFFTRLTAAAGEVKGLAVSASPAAFVAPGEGAIVVAGGAVSAITLTRGRSTINLGVTAGAIPVSQDDRVTITYSAAPGVAFLPRNA